MRCWVGIPMQNWGRRSWRYNREELHGINKNFFFFRAAVTRVRTNVQDMICWLMVVFPYRIVCNMSLVFTGPFITSYPAFCTSRCGRLERYHAWTPAMRFFQAFRYCSIPDTATYCILNYPDYAHDEFWKRCHQTGLLKRRGKEILEMATGDWRLLRTGRLEDEGIRKLQYTRIEREIYFISQNQNDGTIPVDSDPFMDLTKTLYFKLPTSCASLFIVCWPFVSRIDLSCEIMIHFLKLSEVLCCSFIWILHMHVLFLSLKVVPSGT